MVHFKILVFENSEFKILSQLKILAFQYPEFKILAEFKISVSKTLNSTFWSISRF